MRHLTHSLTGALLLVVAALPAAVADPAVRSLVLNHPGLAAYLAVAAGIVRALDLKRREG